MKSARELRDDRDSVCCAALTMFDTKPKQSRFSAGKHASSVLSLPSWNLFWETSSSYRVSESRRNWKFSSRFILRTRCCSFGKMSTLISWKEHMFMLSPCSSCTLRKCFRKLKSSIGFPVRTTAFTSSAFFSKFSVEMLWYVRSRTGRL